MVFILIHCLFDAVSVFVYHFVIHNLRILEQIYGLFVLSCGTG